MSFPIAVLRAALFNLYFLLLTLVMGLAALWIRLFARRHALAYARCWARLSLAGLRHICGIRTVVSGLEHLPASGPILIASQHQSAFDALVWMNMVPRPAYVMKTELTRIPLVGPMLLLAGMIPIERQGGARALRDLMRATDQACADARQIIIFPEGTRVLSDETVPLQPGVAALASHARLQVLPVATDSGHCWSRRAFVKRSGTIHIDIAAPIPVGLRRGPLLAEIRRGWVVAKAHRTGDQPVDNLVGSFLRNGDEPG